MTRDPARFAVAAALAICALLEAPRARAGKTAPPGDAEEQKFRARREVQSDRESATERQRVNEQRPSELGDQAPPLSQQREVREEREAAAQRGTAAAAQPDEPPPVAQPPPVRPRHPQRRPALPPPVQERPKLRVPVVQAPPARAQEPNGDRRAP